MELNFRMIVQHFSQFKPEFWESNPEALIRGVRFCKKSQTDFDPELLYLCPVVSDFPKTITPQLVNLAVFCDPNTGSEIPGLDAEFLETKNIMRFTAAPDLMVFYEEVSDLILAENQLIDAHTQLLEALVSNKGLQHLIDVASEIFGNPLLLGDSHYKTLAYTRDQVLDDPCWQKMVTQGFTTSEDLAFFKSKGIMSALLSRKTPCFVSKDLNLSKYSVMVITVRFKDKSIGTLAAFDSAKPLKLSDQKLLTIISNVISTEIQKSTFDQNNSVLLEENLVKDLILENHTSEFEILSRARALNWNPEFCHVLYIKLSPDQNDMASIFYLKDEIHSFFPKARSAVYDGHIVLITDDNIPSFLTSDAHIKFEKFLRKHRLIAGFSFGYFNLKNTGAHFRQAKKAITLGITQEPKKIIHLYENSVIRDFLSFSGDEYPLTDLCHPLLLQLLDYDQSHQASFLSTLYVFVLHNGNMTASAKSLGIHPNTLKYRIKKIEEITNRRFADHCIFIQLHFSFKILAYSGKISEHSNLGITID